MTMRAILSAMRKAWSQWCQSNKYGHMLIITFFFYFLKVAECMNAQLFAISVALNKTCDSWADIKWTETMKFINPNTKCETTTLDLDSDTAELKSVHMYEQQTQTIMLNNLNTKTHYMFYMLCDGLYSSNNISFISGSKCSTVDDSEPYLVKEPEMAVEAPISLTDSIVGSIFAILGFSIIIAFIYYFWKNYQRRQRINRIFRDVQTDPFTTLQNHMEDSSAANL